ncbi:MAG: hypothetical protein ACRDF4_09095 [Rhabdochlamydiaceae bacterium]
MSAQQFKVGETVTIDNRTHTLKECRICKAPVWFTNEEKDAAKPPVYKKWNPDGSEHKEPAGTPERKSFSRAPPKQWVSFEESITSDAKGNVTERTRKFGLTREFPAEKNPQECLADVQSEVRKFIGKDAVFGAKNEH